MIIQKLERGISDLLVSPKTKYNLGKIFGRKVEYHSDASLRGYGNVAFSKRPLWSEGYASCCGTVLFSEKWASLSHRNLRHEVGYNTEKDIESTVKELIKKSRSEKILGMVVGGDIEHIEEILESFKKFGVSRIGYGEYHSESRRGLVVMPKTSEIILCETTEPGNKSFDKSYRMLN